MPLFVTLSFIETTDMYSVPFSVLTIEQNSVLQESLLPEMLPQPEYYQIPVPNTEEGINKLGITKVRP